MRHTCFVFVLAFAMLGLTGIAGRAAPGDLDTTFNGNGTFRDGFGGADDSVNAMAQQSDGKIVVVGISTNSGKREFAIARYNTDGSLDLSFNGRGKTFLASPTDDNCYAPAVAIQADGRIDVVGHTENANGLVGPAVLARFNSDGSLDPTFGTGGVVTATADGNGITVGGIAIQADGKILVGGGGFVLGARVFVVLRFTSSGSVDTTFGTGGFARNDGHVNSLCAIALQTDGKILAAGTRTGGTYQYGLVRFNANGSLDTAFGDGGTFLTQFTPSSVNSAVAYALAFQTSFTGTKILLAGASPPTSGGQVLFAVVRCNYDGTLDTTFNGSGIVTTAVGTGNSVARSILVQTQNGQANRIFVGGYAFSSGSGPSHFALAKYNLNGSLDTTFNGDGKLITPLSTLGDAAWAMTYQAGSIILAGYANNATSDFALLRCSATNGALDPSFDDNGVRIDDIGDAASVRAKGIAIQADAKIVVAGLNTSAQGCGLVRLNADGSLDSSFNGTGKVYNSALNGNALALQADGKVVAAGFTSGTNQNFALARFQADGSLETSRTDDLGANNDSANAVTIQSNGKIVVAGTSGNNFAVVRYQTDTTFDTSFGTGGKQLTSVSGVSVANAVALQVDGKILMAGSADNQKEFALVRYNVGGTLDATFGTLGKVITSLGTTGASGNAVAIQADGKIVVAGVSFGSTDDFAVVRYNANGTLDSTFGTGGKTLTQVGTFHDVANTVAIQADGKILVGGYTDDGTTYTFALVRYNSNGSLDSTYGNGGIKVIDFGYGISTVPYALALDSLGRAVLAGDGDGIFAVARVLGDPFLKITSIARRSSDGHVILDGLALPGVSNSLQQATTLSGTAFSFLTSVVPTTNGNWEVDLGLQGAPHFYRLTSP